MRHPVAARGNGQGTLGGMLNTVVLRTSVIAAAVGLALAGCSKPATSDHKAEQVSSPVTVSDQWVKATPSGMPSGMTGLFGTLTNTGDHEVIVVSATSPVAAKVELHEVVGQDGGMAMRPKEGGFLIPAHGTHILAPGGDHVMLMDLTGPLQVGKDVEVTLTLDNGSSVPFTAQVREFPGAGENYEPGGHSAGHHG